ncbi:MAG: GcvT family protein [Alphaproteobacteria bacterium]
MKTNVDVAVIGGGVVGCSVLYHLTKKGITNIALFERQVLTSGSSWHAAGSFHTLNSDTNMSELQHYTVKLFDELEEVTGMNCGVHRSGALYLASTEQRMQAIRQTAVVQQANGVDLKEVSVDEAFDLAPIFDKDKFIGAAYDPFDGHLDPAGTTHAYAKAAKLGGAEIYENCPVTEITKRPDGSWTLHTPNGEVIAEKVVNAGGLWAREVSAMVGHNAPAMPMEHQYIITETIPMIEELDFEVATVNDPDGGLYLRQERQGLLLGTYEQNPYHWAVDGTSFEFGHELLEDATDRLIDELSTGFERYPALAEAGIKNVVNGPMVFTPDGNPLVGPVRGVENFYLACGVMAGFSQGGGVGLIISELIADGKTSLDTKGIDPLRFPSIAHTHEYLLPKTKENYARRFALAFPNEHLPAARPLKTTPMYEKQIQMGAMMGVSMGLEYPQWYGEAGSTPTETYGYERSNAFDIIAKEHKIIREDVGVMDISIFAQYEVSGSGAQDYLNKLCANKLPAEGRVVLTPLLDEQGYLKGDMTVANMGDNRFILFGSGAAREFHMLWFEQHLPSDGSVNLTDQTDNWGAVHVVGPNSKSVVEKLGITDMKFRDIKDIEVNGSKFVAVRISFTGEEGYEIHGDINGILKVFETALENGAKPVGIRALMSTRMEKGYGSWWLEYKTERTPVESGLDMFVKADKGDFIGKDGFVKISNTNPEYKMCMFEVDSDYEVFGDEPITLNGEVVGFVTSGDYGHHVGKSLAIGYVKSDKATEKSYNISSLGNSLNATRLDEPAYDPAGEKIRG